MKVKDDYAAIMVQVRKDHIAKLDELRVKNGLPRSALVREAIREYIEARGAQA